MDGCSLNRSCAFSQYSVSALPSRPQSRLLGPFHIIHTSHHLSSLARTKTLFAARQDGSVVPPRCRERHVWRQPNHFLKQTSLRARIRPAGTSGERTSNGLTCITKSEDKSRWVLARLRQDRMRWQPGGYSTLVSGVHPRLLPPVCLMYCTMHIFRKPWYTQAVVHGGPDCKPNSMHRSHDTGDRAPNPKVRPYVCTVQCMEEYARSEGQNARQCVPPVQNKTNQMWQLGYTMSNLQPTEKPVRKTK